MASQDPLYSHIPCPMTSYWCLTSTNEVPLWTPFPYDMAGIPLQLPLIVSAAQASWSNLFFLVKRWGFPTIRHNELRDLTAHLLTQVCHGVKTEPDLQPLTGETQPHLCKFIRWCQTWMAFWGQIRADVLGRESLQSTSCIQFQHGYFQVH